jgi:hypothetical protein
MQLSVKEAKAKEQSYFDSHPVYSTMPPGYLGCETLTNKLSRILFTHIKHNLPDIIIEIREKLREVESDLDDLGEPMPSDKSSKLHMVWAMIYELCQAYKNQISGKFDPKRKVIIGGPQANALSGGARIKMQFFKLYKDFENFNATQEYSDMAIERAIAMHEGDSIPGFPSVDVLVYLLQPQLDKLREPALELIQDIYAQLEQIAGAIVERIFMRAPALRPEIMDIICGLLQKERDHTRELCEAIIDAE